MTMEGRRTLSALSFIILDLDVVSAEGRKLLDHVRQVISPACFGNVNVGRGVTSRALSTQLALLAGTSLAALATPNGSHTYKQGMSIPSGPMASWPRGSSRHTTSKL